MAAVHVSDINKRKRIPQKAIDHVVEQIVEKFKPQKIILFGSYARGNPRPESDVDLLVVMDTPLKEVNQVLAVLFVIAWLILIAREAYLIFS